MNVTPSEKDFLKHCQQGNLIPVYRDILGDLDTPVSVYNKLAEDAHCSFLLESVEGEERIAQFSFIAVEPEKIIRSEGDAVVIETPGSKRHGRQTVRFEQSPLEVIRKQLSPYRCVAVPGLPRFCGGLVGYLGYDMVRFFEHLPDKPRDDLKLPEMILMQAKDLVIFDHRNHVLKVVSCAEIPPNATVSRQKQAYRQALTRIENLIAKIHKPVKMSGKKLRAGKRLSLRSNVSRAQFENNVRQAQKHIRAGDIIQTVLSQRFEAKVTTDPFYIYRKLRALNPSPYLFYLNFRDLQIIGSSPELLVRCEDGVVDTRPIAGTRPRGQNEQDDQRLAKDLLADPKEKAEHIMLVDLGRNDLGRVCQKGSVHLSEFMAVEKYSHVMHIVSNVRGRLKKGKDALDVLQAAFPAGTVSGAPKIRAMEIIDSLETVSRGPYAGCIGYFSFSGNLDSCITIRTIVSYQGKAYIQAGAGIVADSVPAKEYQETVNKAKAQLLAVEKAHEVID